MSCDCRELRDHASTRTKGPESRWQYPSMPAAPSLKFNGSSARVTERQKEKEWGKHGKYLKGLASLGEFQLHLK